MSAPTIAIDTGGTFTDGFFTWGKRTTQVKVDTTPEDLTVCLLNCISAGARAFGTSVEELLRACEIVRYSTTVSTNALILRAGQKIGLVVSKGSERSLYGESGSFPRDVEPFIDPSMVVGVGGSVNDEGVVISRTDADEARAAIEQLIDRGARVIAVSLLNSHLDDRDENIVRRVVRSEYPPHYLGSVPVVLASDLTGRPGGYTRTTSAVLTAYLRSTMARYLYRVEDELRARSYRRPVLVVQSSGGVSRVAKTTVLDTYNSGPAVGVAGAANMLSELYGSTDVVSVDVGGTSVDIGVIRAGLPSLRPISDMAGVPVAASMVDVEAFGGGGGAIARVEAGKVIVGPKSAGALPGPAAYGRGGLEPTVTDADVVLGHLDAERGLLGGGRPLDLEKAREAIRIHVAEPLNTSVENAALQIVQVAESQAAEAIRAAAGRRGVDLAQADFLVVGGAGGMRCCAYADRVGARGVRVFPFSSVFCAAMASSLNVVHRYEHVIDGRPAAERPFTASGDAALLPVLRELADRARLDMRGEGFGDDAVTLAVELETRDRASGATLRWRTDYADESLSIHRLLDDLDALQALAVGHEAFLEEQGLAVDGAEITSVAVVATAEVDHFEFPAHELSEPSPDHAMTHNTTVTWPGGDESTPRYDARALRPGNEVDGPAIVETADTTYVVQHGWRYIVDSFGNAAIARATERGDDPVARTNALLAAQSG